MTEQTFPAHEIQATHDRYIETRNRIERGELRWDALADFFTDDATFIDPAWGRIEPLEAMREFFIASMTGLEGWSFPHDWLMIDGNRAISGWRNRLPGQRPDGSHYEATGVSIFEYAGNGKFRYEEDLLNMVHIHELIRASGWKPGPGAIPPPRNPRR